ncbi:MAG: hypothetical protein JWM68_5754 [Verrucomicrobiales bacterium]|nr:hypothetical protein [Verrucomicrobiales bacterium]
MMERSFEILKHPSEGCISIKRGFSWPAFFFSWIWAFTKRLWIVGGVLFISSLLIGGLEFFGNPVFAVMVGLAFSLFVGARANYWRSRAAERRGYSYVRTVYANSAQSAVSKFLKGEASTTRPGIFFSVPSFFQKVFAIVWLTFKAAFRYRLFWVLTVILLGSVIALPVLIKDDGTAHGFTQILLTYTIGIITTLLGFATLWISCGTLARDIEEAQIQMVVTKPIARWQIWIGKWIGLVLLNALLLAVAGSSVYFMLQWRSKRLPAAEQQILRNEIFVARGSLKEPIQDITPMVDAELKTRVEESRATTLNIPVLRKKIEEEIKAGQQVIGPNYARRWVIDLGLKKNSLRDQPLYLRIKFQSPESKPMGDAPTYRTVWIIGPPDSPHQAQADVPSVAAGSFHEFPIPPNLWDESGKLTVEFRNYNKTALLFPLDEGFEVLYRESGFALNFFRGLAIILCWLALLSAIGLCAASFLSFPVAAFFSLAVLAIGLSTGTLSKVVEDKSLTGFDEAKPVVMTILDKIGVPFFQALLQLVNLVQQFSPLDALSSGRSITWDQLGLAVVQIVFLIGGIFAGVGIFIFSRRELARPQVNA